MLPDAAGEHRAGEETERHHGADWPTTLSRRLREENPGLRLQLYRGASQHVILAQIIVPSRSQGLGTAIMTQIIDAADRHGDALALTPTADFGGSTPRLTRFYRRFGFLPNTGRTKDFAVQHSMIRPPSQTRPAAAEIAQLRALHHATFGSSPSPLTRSPAAGSAGAEPRIAPGQAAVRSAAARASTDRS